MPSSTYTQLPAYSALNVNYNMVAEVCADFITHLFASTKYFYPSSRSVWQKYLPKYISSSLHQSRLDVAVVVGAMTLLGRYKDIEVFSVAYHDDAYKLFLAAYIVAAKVMCDQQHTLKFWKRVGGGKFQCDELVKMEIELCRVLNWDVQIDETMFTLFKDIMEDYAGPIHPGASEVYATPPPSYQEADTDVRMTEFEPMSPAEWVPDFDEEDQAILDGTLDSPRLPSRSRRASVIDGGPKRSLKQRVFDAILRNPILS